jgi:hypothetical protein
MNEKDDDIFWGSQVMDEFVVITCLGCHQTWALDFEPDPCTCLLEYPDSHVEMVESDNFRDAVAKATRYQPTTRCAPTGDDCFCACGCSGIDERCAVWQEASTLHKEVPEWHVCCHVDPMAAWKSLDSPTKMDGGY